MIGVALCVVAFVLFLIVAIRVWAKAVDSDHDWALVGILAFHLAWSFIGVMVGAGIMTLFPLG